jgi:uncharacterized protein YwgA|tara:strand:- start:334 stop:558 length:225 start_codon:yes stop_codon:yes gene_type:complete
MQEADPINVIFKIQKFLKEDIENNISILVSGVDNMDTYKYITATIHTNDRILQEISNLLNPKEPNDDKVTRIRK